MGHPRPLFGFIHFKAFCINDYNLHNLTINRTFLHLWGWLRFRAYPNSRRESWVGVTAVSWLFSTSRGGYHHTPTSLSTRCPADAQWSSYQSCLGLKCWRRKHGRTETEMYRKGCVRKTNFYVSCVNSRLRENQKLLRKLRRDSIPRQQNQVKSRNVQF